MLSGSTEVSGQTQGFFQHGTSYTGERRSDLKEDVGQVGANDSFS